MFWLWIVFARHCVEDWDTENYRVQKAVRQNLVKGWNWAFLLVHRQGAATAAIYNTVLRNGISNTLMNTVQREREKTIREGIE